MTSTLGNQIPILEFNNPDVLGRKGLRFANKIVHSRLRQFDKQEEDSGLSIKLAVRGSENYCIDGHWHTRPGKFLVVNQHQSFHCQIDSKEEVEAYCLYLSKEVITGARDYLTSDLNTQLEHGHTEDRLVPQFLETTYNYEENELGAFLQQILPQLQTRNGTTAYWKEPFFYQLAERLLLTQQDIQRKIQRIPSAKRSTRRELFKRLALAHSFILDHYTDPLNLDEISRVAAISKFHLLRTFKKVYGITPYQLVLKRRLERAKELLQAGHPMSTIAYDIGFSDRRSFTKAFKKSFAIAPSEYRVVGSA